MGSFGVISQTGNNIQTEGLVFYVDPAYKKSWSGPESSNTNTLVPNSTLSGSINNDTSGSYGQYNSFTFDGASDYIVVDNLNNIFNFGTNPFSVSAWFNGTTFPGTYTGILGSHDGGSTIWAVYAHDSNGVFIYGQGQLTGGGSISTGEWYHYMATRDSSGNLITYLNGIAVNTATGKTGTFNSLSAIRIGDDNHNSNPAFNGQIGPVQIYNRALSAGDVLQNYNAQKGRFGL
jgi:hypothetical protein